MCLSMSRQRNLKLKSSWEECGDQLGKLEALAEFNRPWTLKDPFGDSLGEQNGGNSVSTWFHSVKRGQNVWPIVLSPVSQEGSEQVKPVALFRKLNLKKKINFFFFSKG